MLPNKIKCILTFFDLFGYNTGSTILSKKQKIAFIICLVHILLSIRITITQFDSISWSSYGFLQILNQCLQYSVALFTIFFTIFDAIVHRKAHKRFWIIVQCIDENFYSQSRFRFGCYIIKFVEHFSMMSLCTFLLTTVSNNIFFIMICVIDIISEVRVFYYIFCLEILYFQLKMIEIEMKTIQNSLKQIKQERLDSTKLSVSSIHYSFELKRLKWIRGYFGCVYEMANILNDIFGWSHVAAFLFQFNQLLTDLNWMYMDDMSTSSTVQSIGKIF